MRHTHIQNNDGIRREFHPPNRTLELLLVTSPRIDSSAPVDFLVFTALKQAILAVMNPSAVSGGPGNYRLNVVIIVGGEPTNL